MKREKRTRRESDNWNDEDGDGWPSREEKKTAGPVTRKAP